MTRVKRFLLRMLITPARARGLVVRVVSAVMLKAKAHDTWDMVSSFSAWLRKIADFLDRYNAAELPGAQDEVIADLVRSAITDDMVDRLIERVSALDTSVSPVVVNDNNIQESNAPVQE